MYSIKPIILLLCFSILFNCTEEQNTTFSDINISTERNTIVEVNIPKADGNGIVSNNINSEIQRHVISSLQIGNSNEINSTSIEESINSFNREFNSFKNNFPSSVQLWEAQIDGEIMHQSSNIISIAVTDYINTGGAHGALKISFLNFDSKTGNKVENYQLFNDINTLKKIIKPHYISATKDKSLLLDNDDFKLPKNIGYSQEGLVLLYNTYEIAPYSTGIIEFIIPYDDIDSYLVFNSL